MKTYALIMAAGSGSRMGKEKQFIEINSKPIIAYTIEAFQKHKLIDEIIIITSELIKDKIEKLVEENNYFKVEKVILGGKTRADSVKNGLKELANDSLVLVHDGARPLVSKKLITRVIDSLKDYKAAVPALALKNTVKKVNGNIVEATIKRENYIAIQTPQGFYTDVLKQAFSKMKEAKTYYDDAMLVEENTGFKVAIVEGQESNIKATTVDDIDLLEFLINKNQRGKK